MNRNLLLAKIKEQGLLMGDFLALLDMPKSTWSKKIRGINEFNRFEMQRIIDILNLDKQDVFDIFFGKLVS